MHAGVKPALALLLRCVLLLVAAALPARAVTLVRGPTITGVSSDRAYVAWETSDHQTNGTVSLGTHAGVYTAQIQDTAWTEHHHVALEGLLPGTTYHFAIDSDVNHEDSSFTTAPPAGSAASFSFAVYGDNRTQAGPHQGVAQALAAEPHLSFLVHTGDMVELPIDGGQWDVFFALEHDLLRRTPIFASVGNHDTLDGLDHWSQFFSPPSFAWPTGTVKYSSMDWGRAHFVFLDTFDSTIPGIDNISAAQIEWMKADLDAAVAAGQRIFAVMHHGPYSHSKHGDSAQAQQLVVPELARRGAVAILQGHDHVYERGCGSAVDYLVVGGGGAPLYDVNESPNSAGTVLRSAKEYSYSVVTVSSSGVQGVAKASDGRVLDTFSLPTGACGAVVVPDGGAPDAGVGPDGGADGGGSDAGESDAGTSDAGHGDAGHGDGGSRADGGTGAQDDAGQGTTPLPVGCSCGATGASAAWAAVPLALALALTRRRRNRGARAART
jgi:MYXO-CTERM domain-containing protein